MQALILSLAFTLALLQPRRIGLVTAEALVSQDTTAAATSLDALAKRYAAAHAKRDTLAIQRMVYWGRGDAFTNAFYKSVIAQDVSHAIKGTSIQPLDAKEKFEYERGGITFVPTLKPVARLTVDYVPYTRPDGAKVSNESTSYLVGEKDGHFYLLAAQPKM